MTVLINRDQFKAICPRLSLTRIDKLVPLFNTICPDYGINSANIFHEFFANLCEETGEFLRYEENLNYSTPERIHQVWPSRFPTVESAQLYVNNPKGLAMKVYGQRKDLGNITPEDGWIFRGSGPIQLTGRSNFVNFAAWMAKKFNQINTPDKWADQVRYDDAAGLHSACWIFSIAFKLNDEAQRDEMQTIVKRINGGLTNYPLRIHYYELAKKYIV